MGLTQPATDSGDLLQELEELRALRDNWVRRQVLENGRIDILATEVLGYQVKPHHLLMLQHQEKYRDSTGAMILAWRGSGKTKICTVTRIVFEILRDPNVRICLASRSSDNIRSVSIEARTHFDSNENLIRIFGDLVGNKWDEKEWTVKGRKPGINEPSVRVVGIESAVVSKHYDVMLLDDLVDEEWARTRTTRERVRTFYYKTLLPCLEPDGVLWVVGTRYHARDLYGHLQDNELAGDRTLIIPALYEDSAGNPHSQWPEKFSTEYLVGLRERMGKVLFETQYQCDCKLMQGEIFSIDDIQFFKAGEEPDGLPRFIGIDLAISEKQAADFYAIVVIAYDKDTHEIWVVDRLKIKTSFSRQRSYAIQFYDKHECIRGAMDTTAYQQALFREVKRERPDLNIVPVTYDTDKVSRAWRLAALFEAGRVHIRQDFSDLVDELVLFPKADHDDLFDAFDLAVSAARRKRRKPREEPGLI